MPVYKYVCLHCCWTGELKSKVDDRNEQVCPECKTKLNRELILSQNIIIPAGFHNQYFAVGFGIHSHPLQPDSPQHIIQSEDMSEVLSYEQIKQAC